MAYILYGMVTLFVISYNNVFTHYTIEPEGTETCAFQCGRDIQQMFHSITQLQNNISSLELKEEERQNKISALETNLTLSNSKITDLTEQNKNLIKLKTNYTIIAEKHLQQQTEIDDLRDNLSDKSIAFQGNIYVFLLLLLNYTQSDLETILICSLNNGLTLYYHPPNE